LPQHYCRIPNCSELIPRGESYCKVHAKTISKDRDLRRGSSTSRGYNYRWTKARHMFLNRHPLCELCERPVPATVVDHIIPHKGDQNLFWDETNWQALCETCHNTKTATQDGAFGNVVKTSI